jgi:hypothetical protein
MAAEDKHADSFKDGWFTEKSTMWPGQGISIQVRDSVQRFFETAD